MGWNLLRQFKNHRTFSSWVNYLEQFSPYLNLIHLIFHLNDNQLEGSIPVSDDQGQPGLDMLLMAQHLDLSDNNFNFSDIPSWVYASSMPDLTTVILKDNQLSGTLNLSSGYRRSRQLIDLQNNGITELELGNQKLNFDLRQLRQVLFVK
ncbi:unnamed protein product [Vicia faba]|uniref:Uncharacterized protein n=1 Tax=Vicia faba TaxID=3906 RepID=A0AAV0Z5N4_VICFA|nr:unnamed protein product [Vicia faba]